MTKPRAKRPKPQKPVVQASTPAPTPAEGEAIARARWRVRERQPRFGLNAEVLKRTSKIAAPHTDTEGWEVRLQDAFGTSGKAFAIAELGRLLRAATMRDGKLDGIRLDSLIAVVDGARPSNEIEAMLASQLAVTHSLAMDFLIRAKDADHLAQFDAAGRMASKLLTAFANHVEVLAKLQRGGNQTVRVEHVHVHAGAQAIVGNVNAGEREDQQIERQPQASEHGEAGAPRCVTAEQRPALPRQNALRPPLPSACGQGQEPVSHARRRHG